MILVLFCAVYMQLLNINSYLSYNDVTKYQGSPSGRQNKGRLNWFALAGLNNCILLISLHVHCRHSPCLPPFLHHVQQVINISSIFSCWCSCLLFLLLSQQKLISFVFGYGASFNLVLADQRYGILNKQFPEDF